MNAAVVNAVVNTLETLPTAPFRVYRTVIAMLNLRRGLTSPGLAPPRVAHAGERFSCAPGRETAPPRFAPPKRPGSRFIPANVLSGGLALASAKQYSFFVRN